MASLLAATRPKTPPLPLHDTGAPARLQPEPDGVQQQSTQDRLAALLEPLMASAAGITATPGAISHAFLAGVQGPIVDWHALDADCSCLLPGFMLAHWELVREQAGGCIHTFIGPDTLGQSPSLGGLPECLAGYKTLTTLEIPFAAYDTGRRNPDTGEMEHDPSRGEIDLSRCNDGGPALRVWIEPTDYAGHLTVKVGPNMQVDGPPLLNGRLTIVHMDRSTHSQPILQHFVSTHPKQGNMTQDPPAAQNMPEGLVRLYDLSSSDSEPDEQAVAPPHAQANFAVLQAPGRQVPRLPVQLVYVSVRDLLVELVKARSGPGDEVTEALNRARDIYGLPPNVVRQLTLDVTRAKVQMHDDRCDYVVMARVASDIYLNQDLTPRERDEALAMLDVSAVQILAALVFTGDPVKLKAARDYAAVVAQCIPQSRDLLQILLPQLELEVHP